MKNRHATPLALAAAGFLKACGGGGDGGTGAETALFDAETASRLQALTNAGLPEEITEEEAERRAAQDRQGRQTSSLRGDDTGERRESFRELAFDHWSDARWHGILSKDGLTLEGNRAGSNRALRIDMDHAEFYVFTTDALGGGISAAAYGVATGSAPTASGTWRGLMIGATKDDRRDLLQGDAEISFDFADMAVDVNFTSIVNLDRMAAHSVPVVTFSDVPVAAGGFWEQGDNDTPNLIQGGFVGAGHEETGGNFWTPDMTGSFGARQ